MSKNSSHMGTQLLPPRCAVSWQCLVTTAQHCQKQHSLVIWLGQVTWWYSKTLLRRAGGFVLCDNFSVWLQTCICELNLFLYWHSSMHGLLYGYNGKRDTTLKFGKMTISCCMVFVIPLVGMSTGYLNAMVNSVPWCISQVMGGIPSTTVSLSLQPEAINAARVDASLLSDL